MFIERDPREVAEDFYISTFIPISAYSFDGTEVYRGGDHFKFDDYTIYDTLLKKMSGSVKTGYSSLTLSSEFGNNYTAYHINQSKPMDGFVIVGPYNQDDLDRICNLDLCYFNNLYLASFSKSKEQCPIKDCTKCHSLNIRRAINFIQAHSNENITLDDIVSHLNLNKSYFCTLFKKETGYTFTNYVNLVRVEKSKRQLLRDNKSVLDIALSVGFNNQNYFAITFKKHMNMTPMEFRKQAYA